MIIFQILISFAKLYIKKQTMYTVLMHEKITNFRGYQVGDTNEKLL